MASFGDRSSGGSGGPWRSLGGLCNGAVRGGLRGLGLVIFFSFCFGVRGRLGVGGAGATHTESGSGLHGALRRGGVPRGLGPTRGRRAGGRGLSSHPSRAVPPLHRCPVPRCCRTPATGIFKAETMPWHWPVTSAAWSSSRRSRQVPAACARASRRRPLPDRPLTAFHEAHGGGVGGWRRRAAVTPTLGALWGSPMAPAGPTKCRAERRG